MCDKAYICAEKKVKILKTNVLLSVFSIRADSKGILACVRSYHAPAVASDKDDAVVQDGAARPAAALQDGRLQDVPLVGLGVVTFHQHDI